MGRLFGQCQVCDPDEDVFEEPVECRAEWTLRLVALLHIGLAMGYALSRSTGETCVKAFSAKMAEKVEQASGDGVKDCKKEQQKLRDGCRNTLHLCTAAGSVRVRVLDSHVTASGYVRAGQQLFVHAWRQEGAPAVHSVVLRFKRARMA